MQRRETLRGRLAPGVFDLVVMGENWTYEAHDISIAIRLHEVLRAGGWLVGMPLSDEDVRHKAAQLDQLGFKALQESGISAGAIRSGSPSVVYCSPETRGAKI